MLRSSVGLTRLSSPFLTRQTILRSNKPAAIVHLSKAFLSSSSPSSGDDEPTKKKKFKTDPNAHQSLGMSVRLPGGIPDFVEKVRKGRRTLSSMKKPFVENLLLIESIVLLGKS